MGSVLEKKTKVGERVEAIDCEGVWLIRGVAQEWRVVRQCSRV